MFSVNDQYGFIARNVDTLEEAVTIARKWITDGYKGVQVRCNGEILVNW